MEDTIGVNASTELSEDQASLVMLLGYGRLAGRPSAWMLNCDPGAWRPTQFLGVSLSLSLSLTLSLSLSLSLSPPGCSRAHRGDGTDGTLRVLLRLAGFSESAPVGPLAVAARSDWLSCEAPATKAHQGGILVR
jgi:hypothetical protein